MFQFFKVTRVRLATNVRALLAQVRGLGQEGADEDAQALDDIEVVQPLGLFVRPIIAAGLELLAAELGEETLGLAILNKALSVLDVEAGETRLYGAAEPTSRIRHRASGRTDVESKAGQDVVLNGGSKAVARVDDTTTNGTLVIVAAGATPTFTLTATYTPPGGAPTPAGVVTITAAGMSALAGTITVPIVGIVTSGAPNVKA